MDFFHKRMRIIYGLACMNAIYTSLIARRPCPVTIAANISIAAIAYNSL